MSDLVMPRPSFMFYVPVVGIVYQEHLCAEVKREIIASYSQPSGSRVLSRESMAKFKVIDHYKDLGKTRDLVTLALCIVCFVLGFVPILALLIGIVSALSYFRPDAPKTGLFSS